MANTYQTGIRASPLRSGFRERGHRMYLTKNEIEIMDVLWRENRALSRGEILSLSTEKNWMDSSVHILLNSMLKKGAIREAGFVKCGTTCGRVYEAAFSCEEYHVGTLDSTSCVPDPVKLAKAYIDSRGLSAEQAGQIRELLK